MKHQGPAGVRVWTWSMIPRSRVVVRGEGCPRRKSQDCVIQIAYLPFLHAETSQVSQHKPLGSRGSIC